MSYIEMCSGIVNCTACGIGNGKGFPRSLVAVGSGSQRPTVSLAEHLKGGARSFSSLPYSSLIQKGTNLLLRYQRDISSRLLIGHGFEL